jgi:hypothetical protein
VGGGVEGGELLAAWEVLALSRCCSLTGSRQWDPSRSPQDSRTRVGSSLPRTSSSLCHNRGYHRRNPADGERGEAMREVRR